MKKRITAALLAAVMLTGCLAGCSKKTQTSSSSSASSGTATSAAAQTTAKYVYTADYIDPALDKSSSGINSFCASGDYVYLSSMVMTDPGSGTDPGIAYASTDVARAATSSAPAADTATDTAAAADATATGGASETTGGTATDTPSTEEPYVAPTYKYVISQVSLTSGEVKTFDAYQPIAVPDGVQGNSYIGSMLAGADGSVWIYDNLDTFTYDLPANFDASKDNKENYYTPGKSQARLQQFSADGKVLSTVSFQPDSNGNLLQIAAVDQNNHIYATDWTNYYVLDNTGKTLKTLEMGKNGGNLISYNNAAAIETWNTVTSLQPIDPETFELGTAIELPANVGAIYPSNDEAYDFLYDNNGSLYGYKIEEKTSEKVVDWLDCDINSNDMNGYTVLADGRVLGVLNQTNSDGTSTPEFVLLTRTDSANVKPKTVLTMACMYVDWGLRSQIVAFNKASDKYRIVVNDYSQYATGDDYNAGITKLNTEIISGKIPDLIYTANLPIGQYASQGVLEDLLPYIEKDPQLGTDALMPEILAAAETGGHLYRAFSNFYISTAVGLDKVVGGYSTWTLADLKNAMTKLKPDATIFSIGLVKADALTNLVNRNLSSFIDWDTGACSFDSQDFKDLLAFANSFPATFDWNNFDWNSYLGDQKSMLNGGQLLMDTTLASLSDYLNQLVMFNNEPVDFVGYPTQSGNSSTFGLSEGLAITKACADKDGAWSFVRQLFTEDYQTANGSYGFPVNKAAFDKQVKDMMTVSYQTDAEGNTVKDENGKPLVQPKVQYWIDETHTVTIDTMSQEQYDNFMALYRSVKTVSSANTDVSKIISDEAAAYFAGEKTLDETASMIQNRVNLYVQEQK